jgi:hypothetical protein
MVIATRKARFYQRSRDELLKHVPSGVNKDEVKVALRKAISEVDNTLFIGRKEKETKLIDPSTPVEQLDLDTEKIISEVLRKLSSE